MRGILGILAVMLLVGVVSAKVLYTIAPDPAGGGCGGGHYVPPAPVKAIVKVAPAPASGGYTNTYVFGLTYVPKQGLCFTDPELKLLYGATSFPVCRVGM